MKSFRTLAAAGVLGAASLGNVASGQVMTTRTPSVLPPASQVPHYLTTPHAGAYPQYASHPQYAGPSYGFASQSGLQVGQPAYTAPYYPVTGYGGSPAPVTPVFNAPAVNSPQAWQMANSAPTGWSYAQAADTQSRLVRPQYVFHNGPHAATAPELTPGYGAPAPNYALPSPSDRSVMPQAPSQQAPGYGMPISPNYSGSDYSNPGYSAPGYSAPGYSAPGYSAPGYSAQGYGQSGGYGMPGYGAAGSDYSCGGGGYDVWADGYSAMASGALTRSWFGSVSGLFMTRDDGGHYTFSYGTDSEADQRTNTRDASMQWGGGFDVRFGQYFNCGRNAIEVVYWGLFPGRQSTSTTSGDVHGNLNGILNWNNLLYGGITADNYVNVAPGNHGIHSLSRNFEFNNIEINFWQFGTGGYQCNSPLRLNYLAGVRYLKFHENLLFAADANDTRITGEHDEIFYNIDIDNNLLGFQIGSEAQYCLTNRLSAELGIKLGLFGNRISHLSEIGGAMGRAVITGADPVVNGREFYVNNNKTDVAMMGELNLGLAYCLTRNWTATIGYRALAISGVALPADQIYHDLRGINDVELIDSSSALILHGGYAGLEYNW